MANKSIFITALAVLLLGGIALAQTQPSPVQPSPVQPAPVKRTIVGKADVPNSNYEAITAIVEIAPGFKAGRHLHPGVVYAQVLEGEFWLAIDDQPENYKAGEQLSLPMKAIYNEGASLGHTDITFQTWMSRFTPESGH